MNPKVGTLKTLTGLLAAAVLGLGLTAYAPARASIITYSVTGTANTTLYGLTGTALSGEFSFNTTTQVGSNISLDFEGVTNWSFSQYFAPPYQDYLFTAPVPPSATTTLLNVNYIQLQLGNDVKNFSAAYEPSGNCVADTINIGPVCNAVFWFHPATFTQVPSPASWLMMLTGLGLLAPLYRRHKRGRRAA